MKSLVALVGMKFRGTEDLVRSLRQGEALKLVREPDNRFDRFAVQVWARGIHVGYLKGSQVKPIARALDSKAMAQDQSAVQPVASVEAKIALDGGKWPMVEIDL